MPNGGYIKLHRSLAEWEWYDDHNATRLLVHLLIHVNYQEKKWRGQTIPAGGIITSWEGLSTAVSMSVKQCRVAMEKLEASGEVARKATNKYQLVTLVKWDKLQSDEEKRASKTASKKADKGQTEGKQRATTKEIKEIKEIKEVREGHTKIAYAEQVKMLEQEYQALIEKHGQKATEWMVEKLNAYKVSHGKKYKSDYAAINSWVVKAYNEQNPQVKKNKLSGIL